VDRIAELALCQLRSERELARRHSGIIGSGHDADDRLVYNTTTGALYYDADGSGAGAALVVANFQGAPGIVATDITVI